MKNLPASAIVLCGGASSRMGHDKASLAFGDETLLERTVRLVRPEVEEVILAAGFDQAVPPGARVIRDPQVALGPLPALVGALGHVGHDRAFVVACDTPLLQPALIRLLLGAPGHWDACVPVIHGVTMTLCAVYRPAPVMAAAAALPGQARPHGLRTLLARLHVRYLDEEAVRVADPGLLSFTPCNTPDEYREALVLAGFPVNTRPPPAV